MLLHPVQFMGHYTGSVLSRQSSECFCRDRKLQGWVSVFEGPTAPNTLTWHVLNTHLPFRVDILHRDRGYKRKNALPCHKNIVLTSWKGSHQMGDWALPLGYLLIYITSQTLFESGFVLKREESYTVIMLDKLIIIIIIISRVPIIL